MTGGVCSKGLLVSSWKPPTIQTQIHSVVLVLGNNKTQNKFPDTFDGRNPAPPGMLIKPCQ